MTIRTSIPALLFAIAACGTAFAADADKPADTGREFNAAEYEALNAAFAGGAGPGSGPLLLRGYVPLYPVSRVLSGKTGVCVLEFTIDTTGKAVDVDRVRQDDEKMCDHAVLSLRHWEFRPAVRDGVTRRTRYRVPITYTFE